MKRKKHWLAASSFLSVVAGYFHVVYSGNYNFRWIDSPSFLFFLSFPFALFYLYLEYDINKPFSKLVNSLIFIICLSPFAFLLIKTKDYYVKYQLKNYGYRTFGLVRNYKLETDRYHSAYYTIFEYKYNETYYTQITFETEYKIGDRISLLISKNNPNIVKILK